MRFSIFSLIGSKIGFHVCIFDCVTGAI
ncbi:uncharacterized protein METZ01_LOCUS300208 [marine metagenome]|uniref:Uncharacterized protein n=1 Tax=marine metagenome TaxID=408172 RepID=A0A382MEJ0_9ZZZZ